MIKRNSHSSNPPKTQESTTEVDPLLKRLATKVRSERKKLGLTRDQLAEESSLSPRFLAKVESGEGNISVLRLRDLAAALHSSPSELLAPEAKPSPIIALVGMRGAGKSTVGPLLAERLGIPFVEMDDRIAEAAGLRQDQIFELHGVDYYRRVEREVLRQILSAGEAMVLATPGGVVEASANWETLLIGAQTVWLKANPEDHWQRVVGQGDERPMRGLPDARKTLRELLERRERQYQEAHITCDTHQRSPSKIADQLANLLPLQTLSQA